MVLLKYFKKTDRFPPVDSPSGSSTDLLDKRDKSDGSKQKKLRGKYLSFSSEEKATIGRYASEHGVAKAMKHFKDKGAKESSVQDWMKVYERELRICDKIKNASPGVPVTVTTLPKKSRGRPPLIGKKLDEKLQEKIVSMREHQAAISSSVVVGIGLLKYDKSLLSDFRGPIELNKEWAHSVLRRMGFSKRRANSKSKLTPDNFADAKQIFLIDIYSVIKMEEIPEQLIVNWDHTAMKIVPSTSWTMEKRDQEG